jgi:tetratricopeptide (TPR) repeat protein
MQAIIPHEAPIRERKALPVQPPTQVIGRNRELGQIHLALKAGSAVFLSGGAGIGKTALAAVLANASLAAPGGVLWFTGYEDDYTTLIARVARAYGVSDLNAEQVRALLQKNRPLIVIDGLLDLDAARHFVQQCAKGIPMLLVDTQGGAGPWTPLELQPLSLDDSHTLFRTFSGTNASPDIEALCRVLGGYPLTIELAARQTVTEGLTPAELLASLPTSTGSDGSQAVLAIAFKRLQAAVQGMLLVLSALPTGSAGAELLADISNVPPANVVPLLRQLVSRGFVREWANYGQLAYTVHEVVQRYSVGWLKNYNRLVPLEGKALDSVIAYTERHARDTAQDQARLAAEMPNVLAFAAYATDSGKPELLYRLINAISDKAGTFVTGRGFRPELQQMQQLASLLDTTYLASAGSTTTVQSTPQQVTQDTTQPNPAQPTYEPALDDDDTELLNRGVVPVNPPDSIARAISIIEAAPSTVDDTQPSYSGDTEKLEPKTEHTVIIVGDDNAEDEVFVRPELVIEPPDPNEVIEEVPLPPPTTPVLRGLFSRPIGDAAKEALGTPQPGAIQPATIQPDTAQPDTSQPDPQVTQPIAVTPLAATQPMTPVQEGRTVPMTPVSVPASAPASTPADDTAALERELDVARKGTDNARIILLLQTLGQRHFEAGETSQALYYYTQAFDLTESIKDHENMLASLDALAMINVQTGNANAAAEQAARGILLARSLNRPARLGRLLTRLGDAQKAALDNGGAINSYREAIEVLRGTEDWASIAQVMTKLGDAYLDQNRAQEALQVYEPALAIVRREGRRDAELRLLDQLAAAHVVEQNWSRAQNTNEQALMIARAMTDRRSEAMHLAALARLSIVQSNRDAAVQYYRQALHVAYQTEDATLQAEYTCALGELLLDDMRTLSRAEKLLRESSNLPNAPSDARRLLSRAEKRLGRTSGAGMALQSAESTNREYAAEVYP